MEEIDKRFKVTIIMTDEMCNTIKVESSTYREEGETTELFDVLMATMYRTEGAIDRRVTKEAEDERRKDVEKHPMFG